jgi:hypothetical protein
MKSESKTISYQVDYANHTCLPLKVEPAQTSIKPNHFFLTNFYKFKKSFFFFFLLLSAKQLQCFIAVATALSTSVILGLLTGCLDTQHGDTQNNSAQQSGIIFTRNKN